MFSLQKVWLHTKMWTGNSLLADSALFPTCFNLNIHFYLPHTGWKCLVLWETSALRTTWPWAVPPTCRHRTYFKLKWPGVAGRPQQILPSKSEIFNICRSVRSSEFRKVFRFTAIIHHLNGREDLGGAAWKSRWSIHECDKDTQSFSCASQGCE